MKSNHTNIKFSIDRWEHMYSLKAAIERKNDATGNKLCLQGTIHNSTLPNHPETPVLIELSNVHELPTYPINKSDELILGTLNYQNHKFHSQLSVNGEIFNELKKNLIEYGNIDGIHIVVNIELEGAPEYNEQQHINILNLTYAMKGDA